jgi:hypothetical protein
MNPTIEKRYTKKRAKMKVKSNDRPLRVMDWITFHNVGFVITKSDSSSAYLDV